VRGDREEEGRLEDEPWKKEQTDDQGR